MSIFSLPPASVLTSVHPYLNPGTGGLIIQLILGGLFAIGLAVRVFWSRIKRIGSHQPAQPTPTAGPDEDGNK